MIPRLQPTPVRQFVHRWRVAAFAVGLVGAAAFAAANRSGDAHDLATGSDERCTTTDLAGSAHVVHLFGLPPERILAHLQFDQHEHALLADSALRERCLEEVLAYIGEYQVLSSLRDELAIAAAREQVESGTFQPDSRHSCKVGEGATPVFTPEGPGFVHHADRPELEAVALGLRELPVRLQASVSALLAQANATR